MKCPGDFVRAWGGIALARVVARRRVDARLRARTRAVGHLAAWMSAAPAALAGLSGRKGRIAPGYDADLVVWDAEREFTVDAARLAAAPQADAVRGTPPARRRAHDLPAGRARLGSRPSRQAWLGAAAVSDDLPRPRRPRVGAAGRPCRGGQRRVLRAEGTLDPRRGADLARRRIHRPREVDGRLGNAPPPRPPAGRARFDQAHDWCVVRLGARGLIRGVDVETTHFKGNFPESCALDACVTSGAAMARDLDARVMAKRRRAQRPSRRLAQRLSTWQPSTRRTCACASFPDGGVARLARLRRRDAGLGRASPAGRDRSGCARARCARRRQQRHVLRAARQPHHAGRRARHGRRLGNEAAADARARLGGRAARRARHDYARRGGHAAFQGQRPGGVQPRRCARTAGARATTGRSCCRERRCRPMRHHGFDKTLRSVAGATHVRLNIFPDGGVARLRLFGRAE